MFVTTGEAVAVVWTMNGVAVGVLSLWHLMAVMTTTTVMITRIAAPPEPIIGILKSSMESKMEEESSSEGSNNTLLRANTVSLKFNLSSFQCCSMISMRSLEKCTTCVSLDLIGMELQLIRVDSSEHARGRRSLVFEDMVHSFEGFVVFDGQISVMVRLPSMMK